MSTAAEKQKRYRERNKKLVQIRDRKRKVANADTVTSDHTRGLALLDGDGDDFDGLDFAYCSYGPDERGRVCFKYVSPSCGPIRIYGAKAKIAFNRAIGKQTDEYLSNAG